MNQLDRITVSDIIEKTTNNPELIIMVYVANGRVEDEMTDLLVLAQPGFESLDGRRRDSPYQ